MHNQIQDFIKRRFAKDCDWQNGNCYYFAQILKIRFPELCIYYLPVRGHFVAKYEDTFYDSGGVVSLLENENPIEWKVLGQEDPLLAIRVMRDCIL